MKSLRVLRVVKKIMDYSRTTHTRDIDLRTSCLGVAPAILNKRIIFITFSYRNTGDTRFIIGRSSIWAKLYFITLFFPPRYFTPFERSIWSFKSLISPLVRVALFRFLTLYAIPNNENACVLLKQNLFQFCLHYVITCNLSNWNLNRN